jgi:hypothetical protein
MKPISTHFSIPEAPYPNIILKRDISLRLETLGLKVTIKGLVVQAALLWYMISILFYPLKEL